MFAMGPLNILTINIYQQYYNGHGNTTMLIHVNWHLKTIILIIRKRANSCIFPLFNKFRETSFHASIYPHLYSNI